MSGHGMGWAGHGLRMVLGWAGYGFCSFELGLFFAVHRLGWTRHGLGCAWASQDMF